MDKKNGKNDASLESFLSDYSIESYERPSVTTDIVSFTVRSQKEDCYRKNPEQKLSVLLIKREDHPFKDMWAIPGGFLRPAETIEDCALRIIESETALKPVSLLQVGVFSKPGRDPRGWIISNAYASVMGEEMIQRSVIKENAKWFEVSLSEKKDGSFTLKLQNDNTELSASLVCTPCKFGGSAFTAKENKVLAFDHAEIIASAVKAIRHEAENYTLAFDFLPEKFTLASLQNIQEALMGASLLTANFRRKIADSVTETDEYTEGAGHRPARLFKRSSKLTKN